MATKHDAGYTLTEKELEALEKRIHTVYDAAAKDLQKTADQYFSRFTQQDQEQAQLVADGKLSASEYRQWRLNTFGRGERFSQMASEMAERATRANEVSVQYVNNAMPSVYALNRNYTAYALDYDIRNGRTTFNNGDQYSGSIDWNLMDESTVRRLLVEEPELMPNYPQNLAVRRGIDLAYGQRKIGEAVTSGIIRGSSIGEIANQLSQTVTGMSRTSALRAARTAMTSAQNAGRQDQINYAVESLGIEVKKMWMSVSDARTRDSHRELNRVIVEYDKKFPNGLMYPGDRSGRPEEVYNCRCSFGYVLPEMEEELTGNGKYSTGKTVESYKKWQEEKLMSKNSVGRSERGDLVSAGEINYSRLVELKPKHGVSGQGGVNTEIDKKTGKLIYSYTSPGNAAGVFVNRSDGLYRRAVKVEPIEGYQDFTCHYTEDGFIINPNSDDEDGFTFGSEVFSELISESTSYNGGAVRMISCGFGKNINGEAQNLADQLGVDVMAATETIYLDDDGNMFITDNDVLATLWLKAGKEERKLFRQTGEWVVFHPNEG